MSVAVEEEVEVAHPVRICTWEDLSLSDAEQLLEACGDMEQLKLELTRLENSSGRAVDGSRRTTIVQDMFAYAVLFSKRKSFSPEQLSAFFTILKSVHAMCVSTPYDNFQDTFVYFRELMLRHSVHRPPVSTCLYSPALVNEITDYVLQTYFKHFKLYKYAFTKRVHLSLRVSYSGEPEEAEAEEETPESQVELQEGRGAHVY